MESPINDIVRIIIAQSKENKEDKDNSTKHVSSHTKIHDVKVENDTIIILGNKYEIVTM
jgi:hypothetical protein